MRRWREDGNRRVQRAELTADGVAMFDRLRKVAVKHDARLRSDLSAEETATLSDLLGRLAAAVDDGA